MYLNMFKEFAQSHPWGIAEEVIKNPIKQTDKMTDRPANPFAVSSFGVTKAYSWPIDMTDQLAKKSMNMK